MGRRLLTWENFEKSKGSPGECWNWAGKIDRKGYARTGRGTAHRAVYERFVGPIPDSFEIDHLCRNRACVNPAHLEAVDHRTNTLRSDNFVGIHARKTHCIHGHPFSGENLKIEIGSWGSRRVCRICNTASKRRWKERHKAA